MAYHWFMTVEANSEEGARKFAASFDTSPVQLEGRSISFVAEAERKDDLWWGVVVFPFFGSASKGQESGVAPHNGAESASHAVLLTAIGNVLYYRLLRAAPFDVAVLGVECDGFFGFGEHDDLVQDLRDGWTLDGLVVSAALWEAAGQPPGLVRRSDGTYWFPWKGEPFTVRFHITLREETADDATIAKLIAFGNLQHVDLTRARRFGIISANGDSTMLEALRARPEVFSVEVDGQKTVAD